jgi:hypothetical protein
MAPQTLHRLTDLGLAEWSDGVWELTAAGSKLLPRLTDGEDVKPLL